MFILPDGVTVTQRSLEPLFMVRIHVGQKIFFQSKTCESRLYELSEILVLLHRVAILLRNLCHNLSQELTCSDNSAYSPLSAGLTAGRELSLLRHEQDASSMNQTINEVPLAYRKTSRVDAGTVNPWQAGLFLFE